MDNKHPNLFCILRERRVSFAELTRQHEMAAIQANNNNDDEIPKLKRRVKLQLIDDMTAIQANNNNDDEIPKIKRKIKLQLINDMSSRKATFKKRCAGLLKKLEQIAILCDIQACIAIFGDKSPTVWPSVEEAKVIVKKFEEIPKPKQLSRMATHQEYRQQKPPPVPPSAVAVQPLIISCEVDNSKNLEDVVPNDEPDDDFFGGLFFEDKSCRSVLFPAGDENVLVVPPAKANNEELFGFGDFDDSVDFGDLDNFGDLTVGIDDDFLIDELLLPNQGNVAGNTSND
ncbi:hypothetical protein Ahy_B05g079310 [Arachis hypogaea]|uniref:MADS-box domain-containing protein n=1 Tax=Arachis hypogaea TaxID=3818 RepID=A0A444Z9K1_ARAHY|nr:hypothetical protein Ahy_B05g079310 [Arachis hypogaea]